jgi:hypothetical protein
MESGSHGSLAARRRGASQTISFQSSPTDMTGTPDDAHSIRRATEAVRRDSVPFGVDDSEQVAPFRTIRSIRSVSFSSVQPHSGGGVSVGTGITIFSKPDDNSSPPGSTSRHTPPRRQSTILIHHPLVPPPPIHDALAADTDDRIRIASSPPSQAGGSGHGLSSTRTSSWARSDAAEQRAKGLRNLVMSFNKWSTSLILENKGPTARDHLGKLVLAK